MTSTLTEVFPSLGTSILYHTLKEGLHQLNSDIYFDDNAQKAVYYGVKEGAPRVGIWYKGQHVSNVERIGAIPEFNIYGNYVESIVPVTIQECLADQTDNTQFWEVYVVQDMDPARYMALDMILGSDMAATFKRPDYEFGEILLVREKPGVIIQSFALGKRRLPSTIIRIGWREVFDRLVAMQIPNVTRDSLSKIFNVSYNTNRTPANVELADAIHNA